jgi:hypothetical protein
MKAKRNALTKIVTSTPSDPGAKEKDMYTPLVRILRGNVLTELHSAIYNWIGAKI